MFITKNGLSFDGDKWENVCQICFRLKYENEGYQAMPADVRGDLGIEGFTRTGKVFQCYCPDTNTNYIKLYESQRDKITTDLGKLSKNKMVLPKYLGDIMIKEWIFVTPEYNNKDIIQHCQNKKVELKKMNLPILDSNFDILIHDIDFYAKQLTIALSHRGEKLNIVGNTTKDEKEYNNWKNQEIDLVQNSYNKHTKRFLTKIPDLDRRVNLLTDNDVRAFLNGKYITRDWNELNPEEYERFLRMKDQIEEQVVEICLFPPDKDDYNIRYKEIQILVEQKVRDYFGNLDELFIMNLCKYVMADWILRCPISFD